MKQKYDSSVKIPEGIDCSFSDNNLECKKGEIKIQKKIEILGTKVGIKDGKIILVCEKANKKNITMIKSNIAHIKNMLKGIGEEFVYKMEICNVHFPMNVKAEGNKVIISNFLGEKKDRNAKIISGVNVEIKGNQIIVSSNDIEKAGQTAANIEKATRVSKRDRRVFQDGCFITEKPRGTI